MLYISCLLPAWSLFCSWCSAGPNGEFRSTLFQPMKPNKGNGATIDGKYTWTQTLSELNVIIDVPENTRGRDLHVEIKKRKIVRSGNCRIVGALCFCWLWEIAFECICCSH